MFILDGILKICTIKQRKDTCTNKNLDFQVIHLKIFQATKKNKKI